ncbi:MAG: EI24 domain-containing protein, partial [Planctomycetales bacterium]
RVFHPGQGNKVSSTDQPNASPSESVSSTEPPSAIGSARPGGFAAGFAAPWRGLGYLRDRPSLWRYAVGPILLHLAFMVAAAMFLYWSFSGIRRWIDGWFDGWLGGAVELFAMLLVGMFLAFAVLGPWVVFNFLFCGKSHGKLALEVEQELGFPPDAQRELSWFREWTDRLLGVFAMVTGNIFLIALMFIPIVGPVVAFL